MFLERIMKSRVITIFLVIVMLISMPSINAKDDGISNKSIDGCSCHNGGEDSAEVTIDLPLDYNSGQTYSLEITVGTDLNGKGGFNLAASSGTLSTSDPNTKIVGGEAVHSNSNSRTWIVDWMAPPQGTGTVSFTLAALVADGNGQKTNDGWDTLSIDVPEANLPPVISNIQITPANPTSSDSLQLSYDYEDDNNEVDSSSISWFKNGVLDSQGTISNSADILFIDYSKTERDDVWSVQIMPNDGENSGTIVNAEVVILNSKPLASNLSIIPSGPSQNDDLTASWDEFDEDGDVLTSAIKWYNNGTHQTELDGVTTVSSSFTKENEEWFFSIILNDSFEENIQNSTKVTLNLINDIPTLENLQIENINPTTDLNLSAAWDFLDGDGDEQINFETKWYLNDVHQLELDDLLVINSQYTSKGDLWFFQARASDGIEFSEWYQSINVEINNSIPEVVANIYPNNPTNSTDLQLNISTIDLDNDLLTIEIEWVKNNSIITTNYSEITPNKIMSNDTEIGEIWYANITVGDGESSVSFTTDSVTIFPDPIIESNEEIEDFTTVAYVQSITYGVLTMATFMLLQFLLSVKATREEK
tara:strand:+ start:1369 stop:3138 length:1770 start_codon:yes stop_codon:yes gene_type:complete